MSRDRLRAMLERARRVAIFTGAGISTESGIPDFPLPRRRLEPDEPDLLPGVRGERGKAPRGLGARLLRPRRLEPAREPNAGHYACARLAAAGKAQA